MRVRVGDSLCTSLDEALRAVAGVYADYKRAETSLVESRARLGAALNAVRPHVPHGAWLPKLKMLGIHAKTAERAMRLAREAGVRVSRASECDHDIAQSGNTLAEGAQQGHPKSVAVVALGKCDTVTHLPPAIAGAGTLAEAEAAVGIRPRRARPVGRDADADAAGDADAGVAFASPGRRAAAPDYQKRPRPGVATGVGTGSDQPLLFARLRRAEMEVSRAVVAFRDVLAELGGDHAAAGEELAGLVADRLARAMEEVGA